ncbi:MAG: flagellin [Gammaproteobacteria bacterium]|nr:flagellin [Gammaproteobacteria bacterium]
MSLVLNTNVNSMVAQNSLTSSGTQLASALQQLSTGLRVNTAADDAAGYAIAQGMTSQVNGLNQAARNASDGVSLTQTASGAMTEITNDLQTMRDLAVQSLNATNSANDRADLNAQFTQLAADINNVAANTQFNGVNLLDGSFQGADFQIGANAGQIISVSSISSASTSKVGNYFTTAATAGTYAGTAADAGTTASFDITIANAAGATTSTVTTGAITLTGTQATDLANVVSAINQSLGSSAGIVATVNAAGTGINLSTATGATQTATITMDAASTTTQTVGGLGLDGTYSLGSTGGTAQNLSNTSVTTVDNSNLVLISVDNALQQLATSSAQLGAYQNRFQAAITGLNTTATNLSNAKSSIVDTNYAQATSALSKAQILQQAGTAMVAQANTIPQNILTLLQKLP